MKPTFRAAGAAVAALLLAATSVWSTPLQADEGATSLSATHYLDHGDAALEAGEIGLNEGAGGGDAASPAEPEQPAFGNLFEHLTAVAEAMVPARALAELVDAHLAVATSNREQDCLANAVYFEARGESLEGQLAVAEVVLNRSRSGRYPGTICAVVTQPWQFSFVRRGRIPAANRASEAWQRAVAIARIAETRASRLLPENVLWYHADYVRPSWGRRLARTGKIGAHIFYS